VIYLGKLQHSTKDIIPATENIYSACSPCQNVKDQLFYLIEFVSQLCIVLYFIISEKSRHFSNYLSFFLLALGRDTNNMAHVQALDNYGSI
jgi:hypothetical protein